MTGDKKKLPRHVGGLVNLTNVQISRGGKKNGRKTDLLVGSLGQENHADGFARGVGGLFVGGGADERFPGQSVEETF